MNVSELIDELKKIRARVGDVEVSIWNVDYVVQDIQTIEDVLFISELNKVVIKVEEK